MNYARSLVLASQLPLSIREGLRRSMEYSGAIARAVVRSSVKSWADWPYRTRVDRFRSSCRFESFWPR